MSGDVTIAPPEHRPTPTQAFRELAMAVATRQASEPVCEVSLSRNREGVTLIEVNSRNTNMSDASSYAQAEFDALCLKYPYPATNGTE